MRRYLLERHDRKAFVAVNTLNLTEYSPRNRDRGVILAEYGIRTPRNVIFAGRTQARKRLQDLLDAFGRLALEDCGLIIVGPDDEGLLKDAGKAHPRIFPLGPLYGAEVLDLLASADAYCIPGAIGLSIVDAMFCGLPVVTEDVAHGPEIMYLHDGENGFVVPIGDIAALADRLFQLLTNDELRGRFAERARREVVTRGHIDELCKGVLQCLEYVTARR
jgi:glycosyltransferase involved in cell wall biosynthesis